MHDHIRFQKVCAWWVPREQKDQEKIDQMGLSLYVDGEDVLNRIVTRDKSWVYHYQPKSKCASVQWKHPSSPSNKKFKVMSMPSAEKVMLTVFWNSQGMLLAHFQNYGENVTPLASWPGHFL
jgi:hypothetical protein